MNGTLRNIDKNHVVQIKEMDNKEIRRLKNLEACQRGYQNNKKQK